MRRTGMRGLAGWSAVAAATMMVTSGGAGAAGAPLITLSPVGVFKTGLFDQAAAEIAAYDPSTKRLFTVNVAQARIDIIDITRPDSPFLAGSLNVAPYGHHPNSVAAKNGTIAVAVQAVNKTDAGKVAFFKPTGEFLSVVTAGALPDMVTFSPDGKLVLVANEGEPNDSYVIDPEGSVTMIDVSGGVATLTDAKVTQVGFSAFNGTTLDPSIRIFGPNATIAQDLEPEYIAISADSQTAWVTLQENNAMALIDIPTRRVTRLIGLGFKDHAKPGNGLDASDQDNAINIQAWPVKGMFLPDSIAAFQVGGRTLLATANEGDVREWPGINAAGTEARRVSTLALDPTAFPGAATLKANTALGRLNVTVSKGDTDGDGDFDELYAFGARSFSIWSDTGKLVFDSGDALERLTAEAFPATFNASNTNNTKDNRSDDKGPEPEGLTVAGLFGRTYVFVSLERIGGIVVYDVSGTSAPAFVQYINTREFSATPGPDAGGDLAPEGVLVIPAADSPTGEPLLVTANEVSGTVRIFKIAKK